MNINKNILLKSIYYSLIAFWSTAIFEIGTPFFINIFHISLSNITFIILFLNIILFLTFDYRIKLKIDPMFITLIIMIIIYLLFSFLGSFYSSQKIKALKESIILFYYLFSFILSMIAINLFDYNYQMKTIKYIGISAYCFLLFMTILQYLNIFSFNYMIVKSNIRYFSIFSDYNIFIFSLLISIFLVISNIEKPKSYSLFFLINTFVIFICGLLSGSRRSIFYLLLYFIVFCKFVVLKNKNILIYMFVIIFILTLLIIVLSDFNLIINSNNQNIYIKRINRIISSIFGERKIYGERIERWIKAINIIKKFNFLDFLIGLGTRSYYSLQEFIRPDGSHDYPHNFILSAFIEGGTIKTLFILVISLYPLFNLFKKNRYDSEKKRLMLLLLYIIWLIQVSISGDEFFNSKQIFLIYFIIFSYSKFYYKDLHEKSSFDCIK